MRDCAECFPEGLAEYNPKTLATMHGSIYYGDGAKALLDLASDPYQ